MALARQAGRDENEPELDISQGELYEVLSNRRRRFAVHLLKRDVDVDDTIKIGEMAEQIAAWENDIDVTEVTGSDRKRVYTALQQSHLPRMDQAGVVEFDKDRGTVEPTPALTNVDVYMDVVEGREIPWSDYYLGLVGVALAVTAAVWLDTWPFAVLPDVAWLLAVTVAFGFSAITHKYYTTEMKVGESETPPEME